ncbi:MAG: GNAT family N-acetyltransferase [Chitinispirillia bacterium]|jgi:ribosomal protein S18 acetylase RimI-like enzyme
MPKVRTYSDSDRESLIPLIAAFRVELGKLRGRDRKADLTGARKELDEYIQLSYPIFVAECDDMTIAGYHVCRVDGQVVWGESLFVLPQYRRQGIAGMLYDAAENLAKNNGQETVYNWVHPNNDKIIGFLKARGYNVLNLIELRRPLKGEKLDTVVKVNNHKYRY